MTDAKTLLDAIEARANERLGVGFTRSDTMHGPDHDCPCCAYARVVMRQLREQVNRIEHLERENMLMGKAVLELRAGHPKF